MPHWKKMMDTRYIGSWDLEDGDKTLTIAKVEGGEVEGPQGKQKKPLVSFEGARKKLVANSTICKTIATMYGSNNTEDWIGKAITLYKTETQAFGETVECVRVRPQRPAKATA